MDLLNDNAYRVLIRQLEPRERETLRRHLKRLSADDRRGRFSATAGDAFIDRYVDRIQWKPACYHTIGAFIDGELRAVAECCLDSNAPRSAQSWH
ncbi:hypothetical protein CAI21_10360 [Alkalilimnicola ehrlichii]|uniref:N-acetyltransferase domain-containing protein n=1 Tax=Alkalilimnicola ehrlichii TaxID=351052 RepID=A0A3E0WVQ3_9GAMM|nr:hypothetical protein [Alkalilimnicola ehrlichii]RFA29163.1 hypothetical protein CAI21_10360 [Alkalilimnicola ehrlichii]RFA36076.1 hypothetical protein CAL65_11510 [Alkalilimnicola ehrlichii]